MNITTRNYSNNNYSPAFQSSIMKTPTMERLYKYAKVRKGETANLKNAEKLLSTIGDLTFRIDTSYNKTFKTCKAEIKYKRAGYDFLEVITNDSITNPNQHAMQVVKDLCNPASVLHKKIF